MITRTISHRVALSVVGSATSVVLLLSACGSADSDPTHAEEAADRGRAAGSDIEITDAWIPEPANPEVGVVYLRALNTAGEDETMVDVTTDASEEAELYSTEASDSGSSEMHVVEEIPVPAGGSTELVSGGYHIMIDDIGTPLGAGDLVSVTLTFGSGDELEFEAPVEPLAADSEDDDSDHGGGHH